MMTWILGGDREESFGGVWREVDEPTYVGIWYQKRVAGRWILFSGGIRTKVTCLVINGAVLLGC